MVITLDNGQTVIIYEDGNFLREIQPYIDKEIYDDLYEENRQLEQQKDQILSVVNNLSHELSEDNIEEIKSKLQDIYYKY